MPDDEAPGTTEETEEEEETVEQPSTEEVPAEGFPWWLVLFYAAIVSWGLVLLVQNWSVEAPAAP